MLCNGIGLCKLDAVFSGFGACAKQKHPIVLGIRCKTLKHLAKLCTLLVHEDIACEKSLVDDVFQRVFYLGPAVAGVGI